MHAAVIWVTGLPAAGKTTLATGLCLALRADGRAAVRLDGDELRAGVSADLGFSPADRAEAARRATAVAVLLARQGTTAVVSMVSPMRSDRVGAREAALRSGASWLEIQVDTPPVVCHRRDPKGLYARAASGELRGVTGWDAPYEGPEPADGALTVDGTSPRAGTEALTAVLALLDAPEAR